jgi:transposase
MRAYSADLRERVLDDCDTGMGTTAVARKYSVSPAWVRRLKQRRRDSGTTAPIRQRHGPKPGWEPHAQKIKTAVAEAPDLTLAEYIQRYALPISKSALARGLAALGLSRKKSRAGPPSRTVRT